MTEPNLISEGITLMLTGMGMVFVFLTILVAATSAIQKLFGEKTNQTKSVPARSSNDDEIAAASAAVYAYRQKHSKN